MSSQTWWYFARAGGIVAWALLAASMFWGVALSSRFLGKKPKPNWMLDLHRFLGGLAVVFTGVHVLALVLDTYITFGFVEVFVPFTGDYHPAAVAWGVIAMYLLLAVEVTSLLRKRLSKRAWRTTHYLSFPLFGLATVHLLWAGTDRTTLPMRIGVLLTVAVVTGATLIRIVQADRKEAAKLRAG
jgi:DMSO/TMAO reductase YedYZ heme-binding membrane subunit